MRLILAVAALVSGLSAVVLASPQGRPAPASQPAKPKSTMTALRVRDVVTLTAVHQAAVILTEEDGEVIVPILVSEADGANLTRALHTHAGGSALLQRSLAALGAKPVRVELAAVRGDAVEAQVLLERDGRTLSVATDAGESLALALDADLPVLASPALLEALALTRAQVRALMEQRAAGAPSAVDQPMVPAPGELIPL